MHEHPIPLDLDRRIVVDGARVRIELEPACWFDGSRLAILVRGGPVGGARYASRRLFARCTQADVEKLIRRIRLASRRRPGCRGWA